MIRPPSQGAKLETPGLTGAGPLGRLGLATHNGPVPTGLAVSSISSLPLLSHPASYEC